MKSALLIGIGAALLPLAGMGDVTIVRDGKPEAVIVLEEKPTRSAQMGAFELRHHIRMITGAELPIARGKAPDGTKVAIQIGGQNQDVKGETSVVKFKNGGILLTGGDTPDHGEVDYNNPGTFPPVNYHWKGSLFAVYDFLEDYCGVRFYGMDDVETTFKPRGTLTVREKDSSFTSPMDAFRDVYDDCSPAGHSIRRTAKDMALWKLRWRISVTFGKTNHNTASIYFAHWGKAKDPNLAKAFKDQRREMFAKGYEGKAASAGPFMEKNYPGDADLPPQLCYTNKGTIDFYANEAATYFNGENAIGGWENLRGTAPADKTLLPRFPGKPYFYPYEGNDTTAYCLCPDCKKLSANASDVSLCKYRFIADVARKLGETTPGAGMSTLAYISSLYCPEGVELPDNVSVQLCLLTYSWWHPVSHRLNMEVYEKWLKKSGGRNIITLWLYVYGADHDASYHFGGYKPFPELYPWKMGEYMKRFAKDGIRGCFLEARMPTCFVETYVAAKLCYNPSLDPAKILDEYFTEYYGEAGPAMRKFYKEVEEACFSPSACPAEWLKDPNVVMGPKGPKHPFWATGLWSREVNWNVGTHERMKKLEALVEEARQKVKTPQEKARLSRFIDAIWKPALEGRREHDLYLKLRENPARSMGLRQIPDGAGGDPAKIDWETIQASDKWTDCNGNDNGSTASIKAAADSKFLYLKFHEKEAPRLDQGLWTENVEFFFSADGTYPLFHFACGPQSKTPTGIRNELINDVVKNTEDDLGAKIVSTPQNDSWTLLVSFPLDRLPIKNSQMKADFFRMSHDGKKWTVSCWQPTYSISGNNGMDCYGTIYFYPLTVQEDKFKLLWRGSGTDIVADPKATNGFAATQNGNLSWHLSYPVPNSFPKDRLKVILRYRLEAEKADYVTCGVYDWKAKKSILSHKIPAGEVSGGDYKDIEIGTASLTPDMSVYIGSVYADGKAQKNSKDRHLLDCIRFEPAE